MALVTEAPLERHQKALALHTWTLPRDSQAVLMDAGGFPLRGPQPREPSSFCACLHFLHKGQKVPNRVRQGIIFDDFSVFLTTS